MWVLAKGSLYVYEYGKDCIKGTYEGSRKGNTRDEDLLIFLNVTFNYLNTGRNRWSTDL